MNRLPRQNGFTLLELVVVLAVFSIVAVMAYGGLNNVLRTRVAIEDNLDRVRQLQRSYLRLRQDFLQIQPRTIRDEFGDPRSAVRGSPEEGVYLVSGGWRNPAGHPRSNMQRVRWHLQDDALVRSHFRHLDRAPNSQPETLVVLDNVTQLTVRYLARDREWYAQWPQALGNSPDLEASAEAPLAIEVTLMTDAWGELRFVFPTGPSAATQGGGTAGPGSGGPTVGPMNGPGGGGVRVGP
ncbi:type II secretion system minor pseudopilin GspJ [Algiphilus sp.]|uniref:type II secretion system minor pseudopilin GspJ n=1 Tax=Algiphilus sp. TaxID=1872431 RepID=UPI002A5E206D|nr:type II secretion system minor pseudopilin GspJ [Pseudomonadota bacterium]